MQAPNITGCMLAGTVPVRKCRAVEECGRHQRLLSGSLLQGGYDLGLTLAPIFLQHNRTLIVCSMANFIVSFFTNGYALGYG
jgi:hypothetical protein